MGKYEFEGTLREVPGGNSHSGHGEQEEQSTTPYIATALGICAMAWIAPVLAPILLIPGLMVGEKIDKINKANRE